jgi:hypothetical protein
MQRLRPELIDPDTVAVIRQLWVACVSVETISENVCVSRRMVRRLAQIHGWGDRRRKPRKTKTKAAIDPDTVARIVSLYEKGTRKADICFEIRATAHLVDRVITEQGLERRLEPLTREYVSEWVSAEENAASMASLDLAPGIRGIARELRERPIRREIHDGPDSSGCGMKAFTFQNGGFQGRSL